MNAKEAKEKADSAWANAQTILADILRRIDKASADGHYCISESYLSNMQIACLKNQGYKVTMDQKEGLYLIGWGHD